MQACNTFISRHVANPAVRMAPQKRQCRVAAVLTAPPLRRSVMHSLPPEKAEVFKSLEGWAQDSLLPLLKPVEDCWQPTDFLPDSSKPTDEFQEEVMYHV
jgi:acyl-[acyl-carrier-protein] desaturase